MKKVIAIIGSSMGKKSCTAQLAQKMLLKAQEKYIGQMNFEVITSDQMDVNPCRGCCNCFRTCECLLDKSDEMPLLKQKMLEADFIIWGSPVYAHQVTAQMKNIIDRTSYWLHLFRLAGKPGIVLTTTSSSGHSEVLSYLNKIMAYMGVKVVAGYYALTSWQGSFYNEENVNQIADKAATIIESYLSGKKVVTASAKHEQLFSVMKESIIKSREIKMGEYEYWEKAGYLECNSFQELLDSLETTENGFNV